MGKQVNFLKPIEIAGLGKRYFRHPGPFAIKNEDLYRIFPGIENVEVDPLLDVHIQGDLDPPNLRFLTRLAKHLEPEHILEVGTFRGKTTYNLALHSPPSASIITIDLPLEMRTGREEYYGTDTEYFYKEDAIGIFFKNTPMESKIKQIYADSLSIECQHYLDDLLEGNELDFAFIDSSHDYISVKRNFEELVLPRISRDGVVVFDDYTRPLTHLGTSHYLMRKAHDNGYVFYWYAPQNEPTNCVIFINKPESRNYRWREITS